MSRNTIFKVPFHSEEGKKLLSESASQPLLIKMFKEQENNSFCAIHSCAMVMSAQRLGEGETTSKTLQQLDSTNAPFTESNMFDYPETRRAIRYEAADDVGMTLGELRRLFEAHGKRVRCVYASESDAGGFRAAASEAVAECNSSSGVIVNYDEFELEQDDEAHGHFSPLAAYHRGRDLFLLLDTWFQTTDVWVGTNDLYAAMNTVDPQSGKSRGWTVLE